MRSTKDAGVDGHYWQNTRDQIDKIRSCDGRMNVHEKNYDCRCHLTSAVEDGRRRHGRYGTARPEGSQIGEGRL